jgi:hypothetical protein
MRPSALPSMKLNASLSGRSSPSYRLDIPFSHDISPWGQPVSSLGNMSKVVMGSKPAKARLLTVVLIRHVYSYPQSMCLALFLFPCTILSSHSFGLSPTGLSWTTTVPCQMSQSSIAILDSASCPSPSQVVWMPQVPLQSSEKQHEGDGGRSNYGLTRMRRMPRESLFYKLPRCRG